MKIENSAQYNVAAPSSIAVKVATFQRRRMFEVFKKWCALNADETVLDVGVTSDRTYASSNYVEAWLEEKERITAVGIDDASFLQDVYPGMTYVRANGLSLPFADRSYDVVHSSAVLEHVGSRTNQMQFIRECARVARRAFFLTTPNRFFPIEFHTVLPLVHWLPKKWFRTLMKRTGREFFAFEDNLNLLSRTELAAMAREALEDMGCITEVRDVKLMGWGSNLILLGFPQVESSWKPVPEP